MKNQATDTLGLVIPHSADEKLHSTEQKLLLVLLIQDYPVTNGKEEKKKKDEATNKQRQNNCLPSSTFIHCLVPYTKRFTNACCSRSLSFYSNMRHICLLAPDENVTATQKAWAHTGT